MTYHHVTHEGQLVQASREQTFIDYLKRQRASQQARKLSAKYMPDWKTADMWVQHYDGILSKLEIRS